MLTIVIVTVVLVCISVYTLRRTSVGFTFGDVVVCMIFPFIGSVVIGVIIAFLIGTCVPTTYALREEHKMTALTNKMAINGEFFLGIGAVDSEPQFFFAYYSDDESGGIEFSSVSPESCRVYEENRVDAIVKVMYQENVNPAWNLLVLRPNPLLMEFHVPKGTIAYEIDFMGTKQSK